MKLKNYLQSLNMVEVNIEECYLKLSELEIRGFDNSLDYEYYLKQISDLINKEKQILVNMISEYTVNDIKKMVLKYKVSMKELPISLGYLTDAYNYRILYMLEELSGDEYLDYAGVLRTDISHIILKFLDYLINNHYYKDLRDTLILYKYNLIFMNSDLESDFLLNNLDNSLNLKADNYRTEDMPAYKYIDKSILVLDSLDYIANIIEENELGSDNSIARMIIYIINIYARLTLCEADTLTLIYDDVLSILDSEETTLEVKKLFNQMSTILDEIKNEIVWAR